MSGAERMRFCGKVFGTQKDYWVACGELLHGEEMSDKSVEARGQGVNKLVFWVTDNPLNDWIQLPDAKPEHIKAAKMIKHMFTGDLNASFESNPAFPGKERHLLRAQLARIFSATAIVPKGLFEIDEETQQMKFVEDFQMPGVTELADIGTWVNVHPMILKAGRCTYPPAPEDLDEEKKAEFEEAQKADDPMLEDQFRSISEHTPFGENSPAWTSKVIGDTQTYNSLKEGGASVTYAVNVIRSLRWPGAVTVSKGGKFTNIYLGYGIKRGDPIFQPTQPPEIGRDPEETQQAKEPQPKLPPEEKKEGEGEEGEPKEDE